MMRFQKRNIKDSAQQRQGFFNRFKSSGISLTVIILIIGFYWFTYAGARMFNGRGVIVNDVIAYYNFLPAAIVYNDLSFKSPQLMDWNTTLPDGRKVNKTTMGVAYFYAPFFITVYEFFKYHGYKIDVYSPMFQFAIGLSGLVACLLAMIVMRSNLRRFFSDSITGLCLIIIFLGTNAFYYGVYEGAFAHMLDILLISLLIYLTFKWYEKPSLLITILFGLIAGWIVLIRPVNLVFCLFPVLYGVGSFKDRIIFWKQHWVKITLMLVVAFCVWIPQLLYWKYATGHYWFYTYTGETFFWTQPEIFKGIFSYRNGWLVYTPLMSLAIIGLVFLYRNYRKLFIPVTVIFIINTYIVYSWWCWWYPGFGSRAMIDSYALLVFPIGALMTWIADKKKIVVTIAIIIIAAFVYLNTYQSWQKKIGIIHWDGMTKELYWAHFMKGHYAPNADSLVKSPDYERAKTERGE